MSVAEGFICPECMKKFQQLKSLQDHFQQTHIEQSEIINDSNGFMGILKKAKRTLEEIIDIKDSEINISNGTNSNIFTVNSGIETVNEEINISHAFYEEPNTKPQPNGIIVNRTQEFMEIRRTKLLMSAIEMSSLMMKLEKLVSFQMTGKYRDRKTFEQSLVDWVNDDLVPLCPGCGGKFGLNIPINTSIESPLILSSQNNEIQVKRKSKFKTALLTIMDLEIDTSSLLIRKKHHCRICGCIVCSQCSFMLSLSEANRLLSRVNSRFERRDSLIDDSRDLCWNDEDRSDFIKSKKSNEYFIRCCGNCQSQIEARWNRLERRVCDSYIVDLYKELIDKMNKASTDIPEYEKMCQSLCQGETEYSYHRTNELRSNIVRYCQEIDSLGQKFKHRISLSVNEKESNLVKAIHRNCYLFLQNNFATLKYLPNEKELDERAQDRLMKIKQKADNERALQKSKSPEITKKFVKIDSSTESGWAPTLSNNVHHTNTYKPSTNPFESEEDDINIEETTRLNALALQIENVRQYIEMARQAKKHEEVKILQSNMLDLEVEYEAIQKKLRT